MSHGHGEQDRSLRRTGNWDGGNDGHKDHGHDPGREVMRVSTDAQGDQLNGGSLLPVASENGRYVAFASFASDILPVDPEPDDPHPTADVYLKDLRTGAVTLVSANAEGEAGDGVSGFSGGTGGTLGITANGRYVVFASNASNLVPDDTNPFIDIFVKDVRTGEVVNASTDSQGNQIQSTTEFPSISDNGRYVAFESFNSSLAPGDTIGTSDVFVKDLLTGQLVAASTTADGSFGNRSSFESTLSGNGRYVAFESAASNFAPGDSNGNLDIFVKDLWTGGVVRASTDSQGNQAQGNSSVPSISDNGRYVAFTSNASLVPEDANLFPDAYVKDLRTGAVTLVSANPQGEAGNAPSGSGDISGNGRYVVFASNASDLLPGDDDNTGGIFMKDLRTGEVVLVGHMSGVGFGTDILDDGRVFFSSGASDLVPHDTNNVSDIFLWA